MMSMWRYETDNQLNDLKLLGEVGIQGYEFEGFEAYGNDQHPFCVRFPQGENVFHTQP